MTTADHTHQPSRYCYMLGCQRPECEQANYRYMAGLRLDHHRGHRRLRDATPVADHIHRLAANEWTCVQIAKAARVSVSAVRAIAKGQPTVSRELALAILSVRVGPPPADETTVDATGSIRRLRALACLGHTLETIGDRADMSRWRLGRIIVGKFTDIDTSTADAIAKAYRHLSTFRSDNPNTIRRARAQGWHGPLAWNDIDDPGCQPEMEHRPSRAKASTKPKVYADPAYVARLTRQGLSAEQIARQIGCHKRTVVRARGKAEMEVAA